MPRILLMLAFVAGCSSNGVMSGSPDAADSTTTPDSAVAPGADASVADASVPDASVPDAAPPDASPADAGPLGGAIIAEAKTADGQVFLVRVPLDGGPALHLTPPLAKIQWFQLTPDRRFALFMEETSESFHLFAVPTDGSQPPVRLDDPAGQGSGRYVVAPTSDRVAYVAAGTKQLMTVRLDASERVSVSEDRAVSDRINFEWNPAGTRIAYRVEVSASSPGPVAVTCATEDCTKVFRADEGGTSLAFSPDGRHLAVIAGRIGIRLWIVDPELVTGVVAGAVAIPSVLVWSPDSRHVVYRTGLESMNVACADASCDVPLALPQLPYANGFQAWSPDGRYVVVPSQPLLQDLPARFFVACADGSCLHAFPVSDAPGGDWPSVLADGRILHGRYDAGTSRYSMVVDCPLEDCARVVVAQGLPTFSPLSFAPGSPRFAFTSPRELWVVDDVGPAPRRVAENARNVAFDRTGEALVFHDETSLVVVRADGTDRRALDPQVSPPATLRANPYWPL